VEVAPGANDPKNLGAYLALAQVGLEMVAPILLGLGLDYGLGWAPWGVIVGALLGLFGGIFHLITMQTKLGKPPPSNPGDGP
jgi:F0F1-type ATP synthase assembly protein I